MSRIPIPVCKAGGRWVVDTRSDDAALLRLRAALATMAPDLPVATLTTYALQTLDVYGAYRDQERAEGRADPFVLELTLPNGDELVIAESALIDRAPRTLRI